MAFDLYAEYATTAPAGVSSELGFCSFVERFFLVYRDCQKIRGLIQTVHVERDDKHSSVFRFNFPADGCFYAFDDSVPKSPPLSALFAHPLTTVVTRRCANQLSATKRLKVIRFYPQIEHPHLDFFGPCSRDRPAKAISALTAVTSLSCQLGWQHFIHRYQPGCQLRNTRTVSPERCTCGRLRDVYGVGQNVLPGKAHGTSVVGDSMERMKQTVRRDCS